MIPLVNYLATSINFQHTVQTMNLRIIKVKRVNCSDYLGIIKDSNEVSEQGLVNEDWKINYRNSPKNTFYYVEAPFKRLLISSLEI